MIPLNVVCMFVSNTVPQYVALLNTEIIAWIKYKHPNIIYFLLCEKKKFIIMQIFF
jgi:hypothetical protein